MRFTSALLAGVASLGFAHAQSDDYEYIVVGSGAGGGPVAARLALAGHKTLLIEAGEDQGDNVNYTVPAYQAKSTEDPLMAWDFFVRHYESDERQIRDYKLTYNTPGGGEYTGLNPPEGSTIKGVLYPRAAMLGGCTGHNALVAVYPDQIDFDSIATLTGDKSWENSNMRDYFVKLERNHYLLPGTPGHGFDGWLDTAEAPLTLAADLQLTSFLLGAANALTNKTNTVQNLATLLAADPNADNASRDSTPALYQVPISSTGRQRASSREFILSVANAKDATGNKKYPLDLKLNTYVTKVTFDSSTPPKATGVEYLEGKYVYRAAKLAGSAGSGTPGSVTASREVIISGGAYNSPQILMLSGIGPADELQSHGIDVVVDSPGVGSNLQDHYEVAVQGKTQKDFSILNGCTFGFYGQDDPCLTQWEQTIRTGVTYDSSGFAGAVLFKSSTSPDGNYDEFAFGGPVNFRGYFPNYSVNATDEHNWWTWALLKAHPRNRAGTLKLRSADPLDTPEIVFNYFDTGSDGWEEDLETIYESINFAREAFAKQSVNITEVLPGTNVTT